VNEFFYQFSMRMDGVAEFVDPLLREQVLSEALEHRSKVVHIAGVLQAPTHAAVFRPILHQMTARTFKDC